MKKKATDYTAEETAKFKEERRAKTQAERYRKKHPQVVFVSQMMVREPITGILVKAWAKGKTFVGSVRDTFIGQKRNNQLT